MSRSGYCEGDGSAEDNWRMIRWRGAVTAAIRGKRGQAFLQEMADALDAMPERKLEPHVLVSESGACCAMGAVALARGAATEGVDAEDPRQVAELMGIAPALAAEIAFENDDEWTTAKTPSNRWHYMRDWVRTRLEANR